MITQRRFWLTALLAAAFALGAACTGSGSDKPTTDPNDTEAPLDNADELLGNAPTNDELPEDGKYDAVYPAKFDLIDFQSPIRSQGSRGVCSIFSTVALMEHLYVREGTITDPDFSEQFLQWSVKVEVGSFTDSGGSNAQSNLRAINEHGIVVEGDWPYQTQPWTTSNDERCTGDNQPTLCYTNGDPPQSALDATRWKLPRGRYVNSSPRSIKAFLTENEAGVIAGMTFFYQSWNHRSSTLPTNRDYWSEGYVLYPNAEDKAKSLEKRAGHSILIIGWDDDLEVPMVDETGAVMTDADGNELKEKGFWLFKNSWGTSGFGIRNEFGAGYGWLSMRYVQEYASVYGSDEPVLDLVERCDDGIDNDFNGAVDCDDAGCATDPACAPSGLTFSNNTSTAIPDNNPSGATSVINVDQDGVLADLSVTVDISHTYVGDLTVTLISPNDTRVVLHNRAGNSTDDIRQTFTPTGFAGTSIRGDWTLEVVDHAGSDTGTINSWSLALSLTGATAEVCDDQIDNDGNGETDCADAACAGDPACQSSQTVTETNNTPVDIPDNSSAGIESFIEITQTGQISSLAVDVNITHTFRADLIVKLRHPGGTEVTLHNQEGLGEQNLVRRYTPPDWNGMDAAGTWTLVVIDDAAQDVGTLNSWGLELEILP
ncbi:MAG: proprotein convertase P-domain-containing protein [bacterium]